MRRMDAIGEARERVQRPTRPLMVVEAMALRLVEPAPREGRGPRRAVRALAGGVGGVLLLVACSGGGTA